MSKDLKPLSPIAIRFQQDLQLRGLGERTQQSYGRALRKFTEFLGREPDTASEDDFRQYLLFIKNEKQWSSSSINVAQHGLKRFFKLTCPQDWPTLKLIRVKGAKDRLVPLPEMNVAQADALLFGRVTYEMMKAAWRQPFRSSSENRVQGCSSQA